MELSIPPYTKLNTPEENTKAESNPSFMSKFFSKRKDEYHGNNKLAFIVGHESHAPGAYGVKPLSMYEYEWSKSLSQLVRDIAQKKGVDCTVVLRDGIGIKGAYREAKSWGAWCVIESHFNAFNSKAQGTMTLAGSLEGSKPWGACVQSHMLKALGRSNELDRGVSFVKVGDRGGTNVNLIPRSCLIEPFFGDNEGDAALAVDKKVDLAESLVLAFLEFTKG